MSVFKQCQASVTSSPEGRGAVNGCAPGPRTAGVAAAPRRRQRVLLVEDDDILRRLIRLILLSNEFEVLEAGRGAEALALSEADPQVIHLLITDLILPGMDGQKVAGRLLEHRPELKVLFISGHAEEITPREGRADFLQKPFTPNTFLAAVNRLLGR
jgi:DNA-binding response OmpR family regulator